MIDIFHLRFLGPVQIERDGVPVRGFRSRKALALLGYLAVQDHPIPREHLVDLFWEDRSESQGRANLSWVLNRITTLLPGCLQTNRHTVQFQRTAQYWLDIDAFRTLEEQREANSLETAVELHRGEFLEGLYLDGCAEFEIWLVGEREQWRQRVVWALGELVTYHCQCGEHEQAIRFARQSLTLEPWREETHQQMMRLLAWNGQRSAALAQYETCCTLLEEQLGVEPSEETQEIYGLLLKGEPLPDLPTLVEPARKPRVVGACPYRGLSAFREEDAPFFFGREDFVERLSEAVRERLKMMVIVGSSGSGKSSVVFAGLLPRLREEGNWLIVNSRPGAQPFQAQAAALLPLLEPDLSEADQLVEIGKLAKALSAGDVSLHDVTERILQKNFLASRLLLVVDQFEELYTLCSDPKVRRRFLDGLLTANEATPTLTLVLTLRADFMGQALTHRPFADALQESVLILGPMTREELRRAIERPAEKQGSAFEAGLVERILDDVGQEPGNLPLLEFALTLLWERLDLGWMTHAAYEEIGQVVGALARYAQEVTDELADGEQEQARRIFVQLVQPGEGTEDTRRVATRTEVGEANWALVQHLADKRLIVTGRDATTGNEMAEVVHEALIRGWGQLRAWMDTDRAFRTWQEWLRAALYQWETSQRDEGALLRGVPLAEAESWLVERASDLSLAESDFIQAGVALRERRKAEQETQRQQELTQVGIGLASQALLELEGSLPERAVLLALEALENYPYTPQAERALGQAVLGSRLRMILRHEAQINTAYWSLDGTRILTASNDGMAKVWDASASSPTYGEELVTLSGHKDSVRMATWSPLGKLIATGDLDGAALVWDAATGERLFDLSGHRSGDMINTVWWSPDGTHILTSSDDGTAKVWDVNTGKELLTLSGHEDFVQSAVWSPSGERILTGSGDHTARVWDVSAALALSEAEGLDTGAATGKELFTLIGHTEPILHVAWSPDGSRIVTAGRDNAARVWDATTGEELFVLTGHTRFLPSVMWSPDGSRIVTTSIDGAAKVWDASTGVEIFTFSEHGTFVYASAWSLDGSRIVTGSADTTARMWDATTGKEILAPLRHTHQVLHVAWSPSGDRIVTAGQSSTARVWDLDPTLLTIAGGPSGASSFVAWSPKGNRIARGFTDGTAKVWDAVTGEELLVLSGHKKACVDVAWSPSGDRILTASMDAADRAAKVWDANTGEELFTLSGHSDWVECARWSPDGTRIVTAGWTDYTAKVWDADTGTELFTFTDHKGAVAVAAWSPDGRTIATVSWDRTAKIWDAVTGRVIRDLYPADFGFTVASVGWSPDGTRIASCAGDGIGRIWDAATGEELVTFTGLPGDVWVIDWSRTGERILTSGSSGEVKMWDATTGVELFDYDVGSGDAYTAWSPDGTRIAIAGLDGTLKVFPAWQTLQELIDYAREHCVVRELTAEERVQFGLPPR